MLTLGFAILWFGFSPWSGEPWRAGDPVDFQSQVRPLLADRCFVCHGPDEATREADLRLDTRDGAHGSGILSPGEPAESELLARINANRRSERMPPPGSGLQLDEAERALLERWVREGAPYSGHWAFEPLPAQVPVPDVEGEWPRGPIDRFVRARMQEHGLSPAPEADLERWLRRVTYDLTGLPPTPEERESFLNDPGPEAFERVVDRLLASPAFGERMAVPWLDVARYADSYGYQSDQLSPTWPYRDWVVRAINDNLPYDQFLTWQLAGDLLPDAGRDQVLATAFNRLHRMTNEGGSIELEWRVESVADRVNTLGTAFLGLTLECARCHDHKFDPIPQREYFGLYAHFNSIDEWGMYNDSARVPSPSLLLPTPEQETRLAELDQLVSRREHEFEAARAGIADRFADWLADLDGEPREGDSAVGAIAGRQGYYPLDEIGEGGTLANLAQPDVPGKTSAANRIVEGMQGGALEFSGDDAASFPTVCGGLHPHEPFSVSLWLWMPEELDEAVILHRSGGTDVGYHGVELSVRDGRLFFGMMRFWPGNAWAVGSSERIPRGEWVHITATHDATFRASAFGVYVNGRMDTVVLRDGMTKDPGHGGNGVTVGERFRDWGLKGARVDELQAFGRALSPIEVAQLHDGESLNQAVAHRDEIALGPYYESLFDSQLDTARTALRTARWERMRHVTGFQEISVMREMPEPRPAYVLDRGDYDAPRDESNRVGRGTLSALPAARAGDRRELAEWLVQPEHPLTARVAVNRLWQVLFGRGLVVTVENFGAQASPPSHPELLDWLARDLVNHGWDVKRWIRGAVLSATYRQDSRTDAETRRTDPENVWLARGPSGRLTAEMLRDTALHAAGLLDRRIGGPPVSPYQPPGLWRENNTMSPGYRQSVGRDLHRRSLYTVWKRTAPMPSMIAFDAPMREVCVARRQNTSTPLQALVLLNDLQYIEAARVLAERAMQAESAPEGRVEFLFLRLTGRVATTDESQVLQQLFHDQRAQFAARPEHANKYLVTGEHRADPATDPFELAAWAVVAQAVMNLDATVWKR